MTRLAKRVKAKLFQASTSEVYGAPQVHPQKEDNWGNVNPTGYRACYDEGKRCAETLFFDYYRQHGLRGMRRGDVLVAISSSGHSPNVLSAIEAGRAAKCSVITFMGFAADNPARSVGDYNFYIQSPEYGIVEVAHLALIHTLLDLTISEALATSDEARPKDSKVSVDGHNDLAGNDRQRTGGHRPRGTGLSDEHETNRT